MSNGAANGRAEAIGTRIHTELLPALPSTPLTRAELRSVNEGYFELLARCLGDDVAAAAFEDYLDRAEQIRPPRHADALGVVRVTRAKRPR